jgi:hypothetical protein
MIVETAAGLHTAEMRKCASGYALFMLNVPL